MVKQMKRFEIDLDSFCEEIFSEMERIQHGTSGHVLEFADIDDEICAITIALKLVPFLRSQLKEKTTDSGKK
jgi:hypothetical protein